MYLARMLENSYLFYKNFAFKTKAVLTQGKLSDFLKTSLQSGGEFTISGATLIEDTPFQGWWNGVAFKSDALNIWDVYLFNGSNNKVYYNKFYEDHWSEGWNYLVKNTDIVNVVSRDCFEVLYSTSYTKKLNTGIYLLAWGQFGNWSQRGLIILYVGTGDNYHHIDNIVKIDDASVTINIESGKILKVTNNILATLRFTLTAIGGLY